MATAHASPRWYKIPVRVVLATFIGALVFFAIGLLIGIVGTIVASGLRGMHPDMRIAYRMIALPIGTVAGGMIFVLSLVMEIRHHRRNKTLAAIERLG